MRLIFFIAVCVSALPSSSTQPFQCLNGTKLFTECSAQIQGTPVERLFRDSNFKFNNLTSILSAVRMTFCQPTIKAALLNVYGCMRGKLITCLPSDWRRIIPSLDHTKQAFDYTCNNINDVDAPCLESPDRTMIVTNCLRDGFQGGPDFSTADEYVTFACRVSLLLDTCVEKAFGSCPKRTAEVLKEVNKYNRPAGCDACVSQPSLLLLLVSVLTFMLALFK
ncbi:uncharacterized protein LOC124273930 [Haliotis rubra]|uniref:uncharacterized protein LOC124273930 n=1 Tax=Haliotis rubra TaxID=36100 RepID=UPI001EE6169A|nr:uncharacterized protein LOC124273930 [Haliotis rubra]